MYYYEVRIKSRSRLALHVMAKKNALVEGMQSNDGGSKNRYIFVKKWSLGNLGSFLNEGWNIDL